MTTPSINRGKELVSLEADCYAKVFKLRPGDTAYFPFDDSQHNSAIIRSIGFDKYTITYYWARGEHVPKEPYNAWDAGFFYENQIGKNVFLTHEAAQNEFKRRLKAGTIDF